MAKERTSQYEAMFLLPAGSSEADGQINIVRGIIEKCGATILALKRWDERKLAYAIGRHKRGVYILSLFRAPTSAVGAIQRDVNLSEDVLRVIVLNADHLAVKDIEQSEPQPVAPPREDRFDRFDRDRGDRFDRGDRPDRGPRGARREDHPAGADAAAPATDR
jgi:small subunit ribosomal protein S6